MLDKCEKDVLEMVRKQRVAYWMDQTDDNDSLEIANEIKNCTLENLLIISPFAREALEEYHRHILDKGKLCQK